MGSKRSGGKLRLNQTVHDTIIKALRAGAFKRQAAEAAGISERTLAEWLKRGEAGERAYEDFFIEVRKARAEDAIRSQSIITAAQFRRIDGDWKAAAWNLERKYPKQYGRGAAIGVTIDPSTDDADASTTTRVEFYLPSNGRRPEENSEYDE